jgi:hypothetical protein
VTAAIKPAGAEAEVRAGVGEEAAGVGAAMGEATIRGFEEVLILAVPPECSPLLWPPTLMSLSPNLSKSGHF